MPRPGFDLKTQIGTDRVEASDAPLRWVIGCLNPVDEPAPDPTPTLARVEAHA